MGLPLTVAGRGLARLEFPVSFPTRLLILRSNNDHHRLVKPEIENTPVAFRTRASRTTQIGIKELPEVLGVNR